VQIGIVQSPPRRDHPRSISARYVIEVHRRSVAFSEADVPTRKCVPLVRPEEVDRTRDRMDFKQVLKTGAELECSILPRPRNSKSMHFWTREEMPGSASIGSVFVETT